MAVRSAERKGLWLGDAGLEGDWELPGVDAPDAVDAAGRAVVVVFVVVAVDAAADEDKEAAVRGRVVRERLGLPFGLACALPFGLACALPFGLETGDVSGETWKGDSCFAEGVFRKEPSSFGFGRLVGGRSLPSL